MATASLDDEAKTGVDDPTADEDSEAETSTVEGEGGRGSATSSS